MANQQSGSGQGAVKHPESDKRLKENQSGDDRGGGKGRDKDDAAMSKQHKASAQSSTPARDEDGKFMAEDDSDSGSSERGRSTGKTPGSVTDSDNDGRLKKNRDQGTKKSDRD